MMASDSDQLDAISQRFMQRAAPSPTDLSDASIRLTLLSFLCARLLEGQKDVVLASTPTLTEKELLGRLASVLTSLGISGAAEAVQGQASEQQQLEFFDMLTSLVEETQSPSSAMQSQQEQSGADARLLAVACSQLDPILSTDLQLFESHPGLQKLYCQPARPDAASELKNELHRLQLTDTSQPSEPEDGQESGCCDTDASQLETCMDAFMTAAEQFSHLFQTELEPWTSTMAPAILHDIGPMVLEAGQRYQLLQQLLTALSDTHSAHNKLSAFKTQNALRSHSDSLHSLLDDVTSKHKRLKLQQDTLRSTQQRTTALMGQYPQLTDL